MDIWDCGARSPSMFPGDRRDRRRLRSTTASAATAATVARTKMRETVAKVVMMLSSSGLERVVPADRETITPRQLRSCSMLRKYRNRY